MVAIDGFLCGIQPISTTGGPVILTAPAGYTPTPGPGPTQAQNRVISLSGVLTNNLTLELTLPGVYVIENLCTGNFLTLVRAPFLTNYVCIDQGNRRTVYSDGQNVRFVDLGGSVASLEFWAGVTGLPAWAANCSQLPYLVCDGTPYAINGYPYLANRLGNTFGGDGVTTFAVPDFRGRYPLALDPSGTRVTVAGCGINGNVLGQSQDAQTVTLTQTQMPSHYHSAGIYDPTHDHVISGQNYGNGGSNSAPVIGVYRSNANDGSLQSLLAAAATGVRVNSSNGLDTTYSTGGGGAHNNMPNTQVAGIWVIRTGW